MEAGKRIIIIEPQSSLVGEPVSVRAVNLEPGTRVSVSIEWKDVSGVVWKSAAEFLADGEGTVDPSRMAPVSGGYEGVDPAGLFWSLRPVSKDVPAGAFGKSLAPQKMTARLFVGGEEVAASDFERLRLAPGIERREIREEGIVGTLFVPAGEGRKPAIIVLSGSEGGTFEPAAAQYAGQGFVTLALAYFGMEGLPESLANIPVESVENAIAWLKARPEVYADSLGVWGASKGAELALLSASLFPDIKAVVAKSASAYCFEGISEDLGRRHKASWTYRGEPLPFLPLGFNFRIGMSFFWSRMRKKPWPTEPMYRYAIKRAKKEQLEQAAIAVEKINGPVLLTSGGNDGVWPASDMARTVMERLRAKGHPYEDVHLHYDGAGHQIASPYAPTTINYLSLPDGFIELLGGTPEANAHASFDSHGKINQFLADALPGEGRR